MDRFALKFSLGYVAPQQEVAILSSQEIRHPIEDISACVSVEDVLQVRRNVKEVRVSEELKRYIVDIVGATRGAPGIQLGASPRASLSLIKAAQAVALFEGGDFVVPEHIQEIAAHVIAHRIVIDPQARFSGTTAESIVDDIIKKIPVPA